MRILTFGTTNMVGQRGLRDCLRTSTVQLGQTIGQSTLGRQHSILRATLRTGLISMLAATPLFAQQAFQDEAPRDSAVATPRRGGQFLWPFSNMLLPGAGLYGTGRPVSGAGYTASALVGVGLVGHSSFDEFDLDARDSQGQRIAVGLAVLSASGMLGAYDTFRGSLPGFKAVGKYDYLEHTPSVGQIMAAPADPRYLRRWTTWVGLAFTAAATVGVLSQDKDPGAPPLGGRDVAYSGAISLGAAAGEEAAFRGWLLPLFHQNMGQKFWLANGLQSTIFGAGHPDAKEFAFVIGAWAFYQGWLTRRNGWDVRESTFQHFWYDVAIFLATLSRSNGTASIGATVRF